jgi:hypothetical protein
VTGGLIGAGVGIVIGLLSGIFVGTFMGGFLGAAVLIGSVVSWLIKAILVTTVVILIRKSVFWGGEGDLQTLLSDRQKAAVGLLFFLMVFTIAMEVKGHFHTKTEYGEAMKELSAEGLLLKSPDKSSDANGDLVIGGTVANTTDKDKTGWLLTAELLDEGDKVIRKATLMNGIQMHSAKEIEILRKRGQTVPGIAPAEAADKMIIKSGDSVAFAVRFIDPPKTYKDYALKLRNLDQETMKELISESLQDLKVAR